MSATILAFPAPAAVTALPCDVEPIEPNARIVRRLRQRERSNHRMQHLRALADQFWNAHLARGLDDGRRCRLRLMAMSTSLRADAHHHLMEGDAMLAADFRSASLQYADMARGVRCDA